MLRPLELGDLIEEGLKAGKGQAFGNWFDGDNACTLGLAIIGAQKRGLL
jgi:hypothetical protein